MALLFNPPLNPHEQSVYESLKKLYGGQVTNPEYLPANQRALIEPKLLEWCERHEQRHWPSWVSGWWMQYTGKRTSDIPEHGGGGVLESGADAGSRPGSQLGRDGRHGAEAEGRTVGAVT